MGHNVQITYILRGGVFKISKAGYCARRWWTLSGRFGDLKVDRGSAPRSCTPTLKVYDAKKCLKALRRRGIKSKIARKGKERGEKLGRHRWVVQRTFSWLNRHRRLKIRYERTLRAASRYPPGIPPSGMRVDLELRPAVALASMHQYR